MKIQKIAFVCDGGMGSSVMGAAIFRKVLAGHGFSDIAVRAYAVDMIPKEIDLLVCQNDFYNMYFRNLEGFIVYTVENLLSKEEFETLADQIEDARNGTL